LCLLFIPEMFTYIWYCNYNLFVPISSLPRGKLRIHQPTVPVNPRKRSDRNTINIELFMITIATNNQLVGHQSLSEE